MTEQRIRMTYPRVSCLRSQSCRGDNRDRVAQAASEIHRQTVDRAHRRFEQQLANSERELRWAISQRRNQSSSPSEKRHATQHLHQLRASLNNDYSQLIQAYVQDHKDRVDQFERFMTQQQKTPATIESPKYSPEERCYSPNTSSISDEQVDIAKLKGRLARVEYEHRELKQLVFNLQSDLTALLTQQPSYRTIINIPNFVRQ